MLLLYYIVMTYATISVPKEVKETLEKKKGTKEWGEYLLNLYEEAKKLRRERAFAELTKSLTEDDLKKIEMSKREFRGRFSLR